jgi:hypothetical protein
MININPFHPKVNSQVNRGSGSYAGDARLKAMREARRIPGVRVVPARAELRGVLAHPNGMKFRPTGSVEWPLDSFTQRRIRDGDIRIVQQDRPAAPQRPAQAQPQAQPQAQSQDRQNRSEARSDNANRSGAGREGGATKA